MGSIGLNWYASFTRDTHLYSCFFLQVYCERDRASVSFFVGDGPSFD